MGYNARNRDIDDALRSINSRYAYRHKKTTRNVEESEFEKTRKKFGYVKPEYSWQDENIKNHFASSLAWGYLALSGSTKAIISLFNNVSNSGGSGGDGGGNDGTNSFFNKGNFSMKLSPKTMFIAAFLALATFITPLMIGINDAGHRTVVQYPSGKLFVKFNPGVYMQWFGKPTIYNDVLTFDYDKVLDGEATIEQEGIQVRYQDGGTGTVYGKARFRLPVDEPSMIAIHKEFRSNDGVSFKLIKSVVEETMNHTAGLMSSEQSYAEMRGTYAEWARDQLERGKYQTKQTKIDTAEAGYEFCLDEILTKEQKIQCEDVKITTKVVPEIRYKDGLAMHTGSDIESYNIDVSGFQMVDWGYEKKTLDQISRKREATMAIITAKADAERAKQDAITAEQKGLANVQVAKYEKEVEKTRAVVDAQRVAEVAVIKAEQQVDVASQQKLQAEQLKLAAVEYKQEKILRGEGDAAYKRLVLKADGALAQKLETYESVMGQFAQAVGKQKWVPEIVMGGGDANGASGSSELIQMFEAKLARDLSLDMSIPKGTR